MANNCRRIRKKRTEQSRQVKRIDVLLDDVLLEIFDFYIIMNLSTGDGGKKRVEAWKSLVHVCRRWRSIVFRSPRRLNLQLCCTPKTPARDTLDVWPALPLLIEGYMTSTSVTDNIIAALGQSNRVCQVFLHNLADWQLEEVSSAMQVLFPELTDIQLSTVTFKNTMPVISDSFLDGSAPRLRDFKLSGIPFPGLPNLLLSATHLVYLHLSNIPHSGYISPEAMVALVEIELACHACLTRPDSTLIAVLSSLESLYLGFESPQSRPDWESRSLPPPKHSILPALYEFRFTGVTEYLEELVTHIDTPLLKTLEIIFFNQIDFDTPRLAQFISRKPTLRAPDKAYVQFNDTSASVRLQYRTSEPGLDDLEIAISCREPDWQLSSIEQVCNSFLQPISTAEDLYIERQFSWNSDAIENTLLLQILLPFAAVKNLYLSERCAPGIAAALRELVGGRITEVLPSLQSIFVEEFRFEPSGSFQENIGRFVAARQLFDHPITISDWDEAWDEDRDFRLRRA